MELDRLLKFFEAKINTTLNEDDVFLKKYQTKQNSVFTDKDFEALKKDLTCYAGIDFNTKDISMPELIQLYNSKVDKKDRQYSVMDFSRFIDLAITLEENPEIIEEAEQSAYSDEISGQTENLDLEPTAEEQAVAKRYSTVFGELGDSWDIFQLRAITSMGENECKRFDEIISVLPAAISDKAKMSGMYDVYSLVSLASSELNDEQFKSAGDFIEKGMTPADVSAIMQATPDRAESVENLISILTKDQSSEEAQKIVYQFSNELGSLFSGDDDMYERVLRFAGECKDMVTPDNLPSMRIICENTSGKSFDRALELIKSSGKENIENFQILSISALDSEKYEQAKSLYLNPEYDGLDIVELLNVNEDMREKIKNYVKTSGHKMPPHSFRELCKLSEEEFNNFQNISDLSLGGKPINTDFRIMLAKCKKEDIDLAYNALKNAAKKPRLHLFLSTSPLHMQYKLKMSEQQVLDLIRSSVTYARTLFEDVQFSCEDATRSERNFLVKAINTAIECGASTINIPDTVGYSYPEEMKDLFRFLLSSVKDADKVNFAVHCHNDIGLAVANTLAAIEAGATQAELTVNGIGERAGNAALEEVVMALNVRKDFYLTETNINTRQIYPSSQLLSSITGVKIHPTKPLVGKNAFLHESGIHQHGVLANRATYEIISPVPEETTAARRPTLS